MATNFYTAESRMGSPLIFEIIQLNIKKLVVNDSLINACELLAEFVEIYDRAKIDEVVILQACVTRLEKKEREGTLDFEQINEERNRLVARLLKIASSIKIRHS